MDEGIGGILIGILIVIALVWFFFFRGHDTWMGFYYPEGDLAGQAIYSPEFKKKEECISWAENKRASRPGDAEIHPQDLYECGKNCKIRNESIGLYECMVTFDGGDWRRGDYGE